MLVVSCQDQTRRIVDTQIYEDKKVLERDLPGNAILVEDNYDQARDQPGHTVARYEASDRTFNVYHRHPRS